MAAPALQKTWQGGSTAGGTQFVNVAVPGVVPKEVLFAIKQAKIGFFSNPWTVIGSSDGVGSSMDGTDRWVDSGDILTWSPGNPRSWIVLQQAAIGATFQCLLYNLDTTADADGNDISVTYNEGGFGVANGGTDGDASNLPTPSDTAKNFSPPGTDWCGAEGGAPTQKVLTCLSSTDGECTRFLISKQSTGLPINMWGIEVPRDPPAEWTVPAVAYMFKSTVASGLSCLRWETMQASGANMQAHMGAQGGGTFTAGMVPLGPMFSTIEVVDLQEDDRPNPMLYPARLWGGTYAETVLNHGSLFDWYWCSRNPAGQHLLDLDTIPLAGNRTFVCVGDPVIGWLDDSVTDLDYAAAPFAWSGTFDIMPQTPAEAETWLGIDGSLTPDLSAGSHWWRPGAGNTAYALDLGTGTTPYDIITVGGGSGISFDPDYELGAVKVLDLVTIGSLHTSGAGGGTPLPEPPDSASKSFMVCASFTPSASNESGTTEKSVIRSRSSSAPYPGFEMFMGNTSSPWGGDLPRLIFRVHYNGGTAETMRSTLMLTYDEPVFVVAAVDYAAGKIFICVSQAGVTQFEEQAIASSGTFASGTNIVIAAGSGSMLGKTALVNTFEWSSAVASGITEVNIKRYLKYTDGILT